MAQQAFSELAQGYAQAQGARSAWFVRAGAVPEVLAKLGLIGPADRLVLRATDAAAAYLSSFGSATLAFAPDVTPEAYAAATRSANHPISLRSPEPGHASYADGAGARFDRLFWLVRSIGCRGLRVPDIRALAAAARDAGAILIVDNTLATAWGCHPLELGAHIAVEQLDRADFPGLSEPAVAIAVARSVTGRGRKRREDPLAHAAYCMLAQRLGGERAQLRFNVGDSDLAAIARGLSARAGIMQRRVDCARVVAEYLAAHPAVPRVSYPGLKGHPDHEVAARTLMHGFGPAIDIELPFSVPARAFAEACGLDGRAHAPEADGPLTRLSALCGDEDHFLRLFAGVDDPLDIVDSLDQAMRLHCNPPQP